MYKLFLSVLLVGLYSCGGSEEVSTKDLTENKGVLHSKFEHSEDERARILKEAEGLQMQAEDLTTLEFDKMEHDFGVVKAESVSTTEFRVTNTGSKPLIIEDVSASCGCTTPKKPDAPIAPGASDVITVEFSPKATQLGDQNKTVTVKSNTSNSTTVLKIKALVKEK